MSPVTSIPSKAFKFPEKFAVGVVNVILVVAEELTFVFPSTVRIVESALIDGPVFSIHFIFLPDAMIISSSISRSAEHVILPITSSPFPISK